MDCESLITANVVSRIEDVISPFANDLSLPSKRMMLPIRTRPTRIPSTNASLELPEESSKSDSQATRGVRFPGSTPKEAWKFGIVDHCKPNFILLTRSSCPTPYHGLDSSSADGKCHHDQEVPPSARTILSLTSVLLFLSYLPFHILCLCHSFSSDLGTFTIKTQSSSSSKPW